MIRVRYFLTTFLGTLADCLSPTPDVSRSDLWTLDINVQLFQQGSTRNDPTKMFSFFVTSITEKKQTGILKFVVFKNTKFFFQFGMNL